MFTVKYTLFIFFRFNQFFQTDSVVMTDLHEKIVSLYKELLLCFLKRDHVMRTPLININPMNGQYQITDNELYLGTKVLMHKDNPDILSNNNQRKDFFERYL